MLQRALASFFLEKDMSQNCGFTASGQSSHHPHEHHPLTLIQWPGRNIPVTIASGCVKSPCFFFDMSNTGHVKNSYVMLCCFLPGGNGNIWKHMETYGNIWKQHLFASVGEKETHFRTGSCHDQLQIGVIHPNHPNSTRALGFLHSFTVCFTISNLAESKWSWKTIR